MDRLACISILALPLQIALNRVPRGREVPVVLVKDDRPASVLLHLNLAAKAQGLRAGMRYSEALSIVCDVQAALVSAQDLSLARQEIFETLSSWSPQIEACPMDYGSFWLNPTGLSGLYGSEAQWGASVRAALALKGYRAVVVVGETRGGTYVLARSRRRSTVVKSSQAEKRAMDEAPLSIFGLSTRPLRLLERLGIRTVGRLMKIPADEVNRRFGPDLVREVRQLETLSTLPLQTPSLPPN